MATEARAAQAPRSLSSTLLTVLGFAGVAGAFLPFAWDASPFEAASYAPILGRESLFGNALWPLAVPALLPVPIAIAEIRSLAAGRLSRAERVCFYFLALAGISCFLSLYRSSESLPTEGGEWVTFVFGLAAPLAGGWLLWRDHRAGESPDRVAVAAMQLVYVIVAIVALVGFFSDGLEIGAYCVALGAAAYAIQIVRMSLTTRRRQVASPFVG